MRIRSVRVGAIAGAVGGMAMAMWSMAVLAVTGHGFWNPVNLIAHTAYDKAPLDGTLNAAAVLVGIGIHMMIAMGLGVVIALLAERLGASAAVTVAVALGASVLAWLVALVAWDAIDATAFHAFTPWVLLTAHAMFGLTAGVVIAAHARRSVPLRSDADPGRLHAPTV